MSQRANQQTRSHSTSSTAPALGATASNAPRGAAKQARPSLLKKASALFFGVGLSERHPERERQAQARREERARRRAAAQQSREEGGYDAPVAAHMFSGRSFLTAVVVGVIALGTAYPVVTYFDQDREIKQINAHISQLQQENAQLKAEQTWWNDDNYVRQQARSRLYYVNPGDTPYVVTGITKDSTKADGTSANAKNAPEDAWTTKIWDSLERTSPATGRNPRPGKHPA